MECIVGASTSPPAAAASSISVSVEPLRCEAGDISPADCKETPPMSPTKKSRKKTKIRGPRNFNLKSREVVSDSDSSAAGDDDEAGFAAASSTGAVTTAKRSGAVGSPSNLMLLAKRRRTAESAPTPTAGSIKRQKRAENVDEEEEKRRVSASDRRRNSSNNLLLSLAGVKREEDNEDEEEEEQAGGSSLVCEETIPGSSPDQKQPVSSKPGRRGPQQDGGLATGSPTAVKTEEEEVSGRVGSGPSTPKQELSSPSTPDSGQVGAFET